MGLYREEFNFINSKLRSNYGVEKKLNHTHRFIDDVNPKNDNDNFGKFVKDIYTHELKVTKGNEVSRSVSPGSAYIHTSVRKKLPDPLLCVLENPLWLSDR